MTTATRERILEAALENLRAGQPVSLDSAARGAGLTKPGLMHHFPTKQALMLGLVDLVSDRWEEQLTRHLGGGADGATPAARIRAYVDYAVAGDFDETDMIVFGDPRLRPALSARWTEQMQRWFDLPADLPEVARGRLTAARLLADGVWFAISTGVFPPSASEREQVRAVAYTLLEN